VTAPPGRAVRQAVPCGKGNPRAPVAGESAVWGITARPAAVPHNASRHGPAVPHNDSGRGPAVPRDAPRPWLHRLDPPRNLPRRGSPVASGPGRARCGEFTGSVRPAGFTAEPGAWRGL